MINRENLIKIGRAGGKTSKWEIPDQITRVGWSNGILVKLGNNFRHLRFVQNQIISQAFRQGKLFDFGQNTSEIIPLFHEYTIIFWLAINIMGDKLPS